MLTLTDIASGVTHKLTSGKPLLPTGTLRENGQYIIEAQGVSTSKYRLLVSDQEIEPRYKESSPTKTAFRWLWLVSEYAGEVLVSLLDGDWEIFFCTLDVSPHPNKLGSESYSELLADLQEMAEGLLFGMTPSHLLVEQQEASAPPMARFALLRAYFSKLDKASRAVAQTPHRRLVAEREERPLHKVHQVDTRSLRLAVRRMPVLMALRHKEERAAATPPKLDVPHRIHTFNTPPNRHILSLLIRLIALSADLKRRFDLASSENTSGNADISSRAARWASLTEGFLTELQKLSRVEFLAGLMPSKLDAAALMTIARHPAYAQFDQVARKILNPHVAPGESSDIPLTLRPTYDIYEYWCFFQLADALQQAVPAATWKSSITIRQSNLLLTLPNGSRIEGNVADRYFCLTFQKGYGSRQPRSQTYSITKTCVPDFVLECRQGVARRLIIFDAKYRASVESIHSALSDIHVYRDAIREPSGQSAIHAAFILTPAHDPQVDRYYCDKYRQEFLFGGFDLAPRNLDHLRCLKEAIENLTTFLEA